MPSKPTGAQHGTSTTLCSDSRHLPKDEAEAREQLAEAYRIADRLGLSDLIWGHISSRIPGCDHFLTIDFPQLWSEVSAHNLVVVNGDGEIIEDPSGKARKYRVHPAWGLHGAVHKHRSDANCIVHAHTPESMAFLGLGMRELAPINQEAMDFYKRLSWHEYNTIPYQQGTIPLIVQSIGKTNRAMLLQAHGLMTTGETVGEAVVRMHYLNRCIIAQLKAMSCGASLCPQPSDICEEFAHDSEKYNEPGRYEWEALTAQDRLSPEPFGMQNQLGIVSCTSRVSEVISFWFRAGSGIPNDELWFGYRADQDMDVRTRFGPLVLDALGSGLHNWERLGWQGSLAAIIVLDQFTRMVFRGSCGAYSGDNHALAIAKRLLGSADAAEMTPLQRLFAILPMQHSESLVDQKGAVALMDALVADAGSDTELVQHYLVESTEFARSHQEIIGKFGRFPHRNAVLCRNNTNDELKFLYDTNNNTVGAGWGQQPLLRELDSHL